MQFLNSKRGLVVGLVVVALMGTVVWAATEVTINKTSSKYASFNSYDGTTRMFVTIMEADEGYVLSYAVYTLSPLTWVERGYGTIGSGDASISSNSAWVDTDTSDIAIIGDGGDLDLDWTTDGVFSFDNDSKTTQNYGDRKIIRFGGTSQDSAVVSGDMFGDTVDGTGTISSTKGKTITQVK